MGEYYYTGIGSGSIWNRRCSKCNKKIRQVFQQGTGTVVGYECGELLFCDNCWNRKMNLQQYRRRLRHEIRILSLLTEIISDNNINMSDTLKLSFKACRMARRKKYERPKTIPSQLKEMGTKYLINHILEVERTKKIPPIKKIQIKKIT